MKHIWVLYPKVVADVKSTQQQYKIQGHHDWIHALRVGEMAKEIAWREWGDPVIAAASGLAGLFHNADRIMQTCSQMYECVPPNYIKNGILKLCNWWLKLTENVVPGVDHQQIIIAVIEHDQINGEDDNKIKIALQDADRIVNLSLDMFIRSGQLHHRLPAVDFVNYTDDPEATYENPKSVLRDVAYSLDWVNPNSKVCIRTKVGMAIAEPRAELYRHFITSLYNQLKNEGVLPFPRSIQR